MLKRTYLFFQIMDTFRCQIRICNPLQTRIQFGPRMKLQYTAYNLLRFISWKIVFATYTAYSQNSQFMTLCRDINENVKYHQKSQENTISISVTLNLLQCDWRSTEKKLLKIFMKYSLNNIRNLTLPTGKFPSQISIPPKNSFSQTFLIVVCYHFFTIPKVFSLFFGVFLCNSISLNDWRTLIWKLDLNRKIR